MITKDILTRNFKRIITHNDFDGIVSGALISYVFKIQNIFFTGPANLEKGFISINEDDIICDLPYSDKCGLWFDHHEGNKEQLEYLGINVDKVTGKIDLKPSCARVIYETFMEIGFEFPSYFNKTVEVTDKIDSFDYNSIEEWRKESSENIINESLKKPNMESSEQRQYQYNLLKLLRDKSIQEVASNNEVKENYYYYKNQEENMIKILKECCYFLENDKNKEVVIVDLTKYSRKLNIDKRLSYVLYPEAKASLSVYNQFDRGVKTNSLGFSMALSIILSGPNTKHSKDIGEIMRSLNIGDGHKGAAAGTVFCKSKNEMLKKKDEYLKQILNMWFEQSF